MQESEQQPLSEKKDYLTTNYQPGQKVPEEEFILRIENYYLKDSSNHPQSISIMHLDQQIETITKILNGQIDAKTTMLMGAPGTGKTILMKYFREIFPNYAFLHFSTFDLATVPKQHIQIIFKMAQFYSPCAIVFDELDYCAHQWPQTFQIIKQQINQRQNKGNKVWFFAICSRPDKVSLEKWPNIDQIIKFQPLSHEQYAEVCQKKMYQGGYPNKFTEEQKQEVIEALKNNEEKYTFSDIATLMRDALYEPIRRLQQQYSIQQMMALDKNNTDIVKVEFNDLIKSIGRVKPSISNEKFNQVENFSIKKIGQI